MIVGAHSIVYSKDPDADRAFFRDVLGLPSADAGHGWLIFGLPPSEVAFHPSDTGGTQELYLLVQDAAAFAGTLAGRGVPCTEVSDQGWGLLLHITLPGGSRLGVYEPRHPRPPNPLPLDR